MSAAAPEKASILIVDDIEENLVALEAVLGPLGQHLVRARSGEEALKAMLRQDFAVVLLDVMMPGMDGFETAASIKRLDQTRDVPIILLTGNDAPTDYAYRGYVVGVADFLIKPIDPWLLRTKVNVFLDLHRKNRQLAARAEQLRQSVDAERQPGTEAGSGQQLADIAARLGRLELMLREAEGADAPGLADRIAELERAIHSLRTQQEGAARQRSPPAALYEPDVRPSGDLPSAAGGVSPPSGERS
jgi:CheY-like chemotaxis protein